MSVPPGDQRSFSANDQQTGTLLAVLQQALGDMRPELIRIATSYFTPDGFLELQDGLCHGRDVRILLGERRGGRAPRASAASDR